jgi:hypothetical protein
VQLHFGHPAPQSRPLTPLPPSIHYVICREDTLYDYLLNPKKYIPGESDWRMTGGW